MEKKEIEDLSNLVFGLALTIGAVTLVAPVADDASLLVGAILNFALSFFIIVWIWWIYNTITKRSHGETRLKFGLNLVLLFLVVIEPFLLSVTNRTVGSVAYAIDIGTILLILATYNELAIREAPVVSDRTVERWRWSRNFQVICALVFYASIAIAFFPDVASAGVQGMIWFVVFLIAVLSGFILDSRERRRAQGKAGE